MGDQKPTCQIVGMVKRSGLGKARRWSLSLARDENAHSSGKGHPVASFTGCGSAKSAPEVPVGAEGRAGAGARQRTSAIEN